MEEMALFKWGVQSSVHKKCVKGTSAIPPQNFVHLHQLKRIFEKITTYNDHSTSEENAEIDSLISEDFTSEVVF